MTEAHTHARPDFGCGAAMRQNAATIGRYRLTEQAAQHVDGSVDAGGVDVQVGQGPDALGAFSQHPDALSLESGAEIGGCAARLVEVEEHDVGLHLGRVDADPRHLSRGAGQAAGVGVVVSQAVDDRGNARAGAQNQAFYGYDLRALLTDTARSATVLR